MGKGLLEVAALLVLTVVVLPCAFFTLLALLDRFEQRLSQPHAAATNDLKTVGDPVEPHGIGADVVALPIADSASTGSTGAAISSPAAVGPTAAAV